MDTKKGSLICFIGCSGCGKSSHSRKVIANLFECGYSAYYIHISGYPLLDAIPQNLRSLFSSLITKHAQNNNVPTTDRGDSTNMDNNINNNISFKTLVILFILWVVNIPHIIKILLHKRKSIVVCDRYFYYYLANIWGWSPPKYLSEIYRIWRKMIPRPDLVLLFTIPPHIAYSRDDEFPLSFYLAQLKWFDTYYQKYSEDNVIQIKNTRPFYETNSQIFKFIISTISLENSTTSGECF